MRFGLQKLGRFASGRLQGSKGVQKYDKFMEKSPVVRNLLTAGDIAGATLGGAALLGGGLSGAGVKAGLGKIGSAVKSSAGGVKSMLTGGDTASGGSGVSGLLKGAGQAAKEVGGFVERNKAISELGVKGLLSQLPNEENAINRQRLDLETRRVDMTEQQIEEERERKRYVMQYLRQQYPQYFQNG